MKQKICAGMPNYEIINTIEDDGNTIILHEIRFAAFDLFQLIPNSIYLSVSFYEIYCSKLFDLLNDRLQLVAREDAKGQVNIAELQQIQDNLIKTYIYKQKIKKHISIKSQQFIEIFKSDSLKQCKLKFFKITWILKINLKQQNNQKVMIHRFE
ncbi:unnamed protein product [Paramecium sonneborni]|uniref:Kinesin motor domain-containing protein n=1 Tax=Paramecium sonneborni TaxID=65129 RepID=A0A8S1PKD8_9CILI|nr:unnamed protein product [Paramecium sonneborni]